MEVVLPAGWRTRTRAMAGSWLSLAMILVALATAPAVVRGQRVSGALAVSLTVLPPVSTQPVELLSFRMESNGIARLETTPPIAAAVSLIVMSTVASSASDFIPVAQAPALVHATPRNTWGESAPRSHDLEAARMRHVVKLGPTPIRSEPHDVSVHITYLVSPGT